MKRTRFGQIKGMFVSILVVASVTPAAAQRVRRRSAVAHTKIAGPTATTVSSELVQGRLNPAISKSGDAIVLRLKEDVKSNGEVVLQKGAMITGFVRKVNCMEGDSNASQAQSFIGIEWITPQSKPNANHQVMLAVQSVNQTDLNDVETVSYLESRLPAASNANSASPMKTNVALLSMPTVVAADAQTTHSLGALGMSGGSQLFQTGRGQVTAGNGTRVSVDLFSHLNNDTVVSSKAKDFEISIGAQMQLLVGVARR